MNIIKAVFTAFLQSRKFVNQFITIAPIKSVPILFINIYFPNVKQVGNNTFDPKDILLDIVVLSISHAI
jgi:hypothetical protein